MELDRPFIPWSLLDSFNQPNTVDECLAICWLYDMNIGSSCFDRFLTWRRRPATYFESGESQTTGPTQQKHIVSFVFVVFDNEMLFVLSDDDVSWSGAVTAQCDVHQQWIACSSIVTSCRREAVSIWLRVKIALFQPIYRRWRRRRHWLILSDAHDWLMGYVFN